MLLFLTGSDSLDIVPPSILYESSCHLASVSVLSFYPSTHLLSEQKVVEEVEKKQELTEEDVEEMFDPALTRHKGQVRRQALTCCNDRCVGKHSRAAMTGA